MSVAEARNAALCLCGHSFDRHLAFSRFCRECQCSTYKQRPSVWEPIKRPTCDLCPKPAAWRHPNGGFRCNTCSRPEEPKP